MHWRSVIFLTYLLFASMLWGKELYPMGGFVGHSVTEHQAQSSFATRYRNFTHNSLQPSFRYDLYSMVNHLQEYSVEQYKQHFSGCSAQHILKQHPLFMSNEFVSFAKNLSGYEATITTLHGSAARTKWLF